MARDKLTGHIDVLGAIKQVALAQLAAGGPGAVSVNAIGRELGVSGPALYRYVAGRDELITALVVDAYEDLALVMAYAAAGRRTARTRLTAVVAAYRGFAREAPHRYRLLFRDPLPGLDGNTPEPVRASQAAMDVLTTALAGANPPARPDDIGLAAWIRSRDMSPDAAPAARAALALWPQIHGLASLEIEGCFASMGLDPAPLYADAIAAALHSDHA